MTLGSLFAGIGGFELAATWAGIEPVWSNEIDKFACKVLRKNFDHEIIQKDIREIGRKDLRSVDIVSGGPPCQPASHAGKRKGENDDRWLWGENLRIVSELKPAFTVFENPPGILSLDNGKAFDRILYTLEDQGYQNEIFNIPACGVGAWHRRERIWIVSTRNDIYSSCTNPNSKRPHRSKIEQQGETELRHKQISIPKGLGKNVSDTQIKNDRESDSISKKGQIQQPRISIEQTGGEYWAFEPNVGRVANGISGRVDRLKGLGNAIVPQVAYEIFKAITEIQNK